MIRRTPSGDPEVESIVRSLEARLFAPSAVIERVVCEELLRFPEARVRNFAPILVERAVANRLAGSLTLGEWGSSVSTSNPAPPAQSGRRSGPRGVRITPSE